MNKALVWRPTPLALALALAAACSPPMAHAQSLAGAAPAAVSLSAPAPAVTSASALPASPVLSLSEAYQSALRHDATYRATQHDVDFARSGTDLAAAALKPSLNFSASYSEVEGWRRFSNSQNQDVRTRLDYQAPQASLQLRVPVFNGEALAGHQISKVQVDIAELRLGAMALELLERVTDAYLRALTALESRTVIASQVEAAQQQLAQAGQRLQRGEGTRVQVAQLQASLDMAVARQVDVENMLQVALSQLQHVTGLQVVDLRRLPSATVDVQPPVEQLGDWLDMARRQSATLQAQARAIDMAKLAVKRERAGHLPRLDVVASMSHSENDSVSSIGQTNNQRSVGVQLSIPLYSGGGIEAGARQALARQARAEEDYRDTRETLERDIQRFYLATQSGVRTIAAYQQAVSSSELAWTGARRSLELGSGTASDMAQAQSTYFTAIRDLAQVRSEHLMARVRLMARAGMRAHDIATDFDTLLVTAPAATPIR